MTFFHVQTSIEDGKPVHRRGGGDSGPNCLGCSIIMCEPPSVTIYRNAGDHEFRADFCADCSSQRGIDALEALVGKIVAILRKEAAE